MSNTADAKKNWTVLAYMAGDNNLTEEMVWSLQDMKETLETEIQGANGKYKVGERVGALAQYDARGLNPQLLLLNSDGHSPGADGNLDKTRNPDYHPRDVWKTPKPTPEHWAIAIMHQHRTDEPVSDLIGDLKYIYTLEEEQANQVLTDLIMHAVGSRKPLLFGDRTRSVVTAATTAGQPTPTGTQVQKPLAVLAKDEDMLLALTVATAKTKGPAPTREEVNRQLLTAAPAAATAPTEQAAEKGTEEKRKLDYSRIQEFLSHVDGLKLDDWKNEQGVKKLADRLATSRDSVLHNTRELSSPLMLRDFIAGQFDLIRTKGLAAEHYIAILSGHGGGATGDFLPDEDPPSSLTIPILGEILREAVIQLRAKDPNRSGRSFDILGIDSCLMGMAEVAYELRDSVDYLVASEGFVANAGWPYHRVLEALAEDHPKPEEAAARLVERYAAFYQDYEMGGSSTHLAALKLSAFREPEGGRQRSDLVNAITDLAGSLKTALDSLTEDAEENELRGPVMNWQRNVRDALILAHWYAQSFKFEKYVDLWDFCGQLARFLPHKSHYESIRKYCTEVQLAIKQAVLRSCYNGPEFQHAHGISIYFPWSAQDFAPEYAALSFARDTGWSDFLTTYLRKTRRLRRAHHPGAEPRRLGSDVEQLMQQLEWPLGRFGSPYGSRFGSPYGSRFGSPYGSRFGSPYGAKMEGGKVVCQAAFKNVPDGFLRQDHSRDNRFIDNKQAGFIYENGEVRPEGQEGP